MWQDCIKCSFQRAPNIRGDTRVRVRLYALPPAWLAVEGDNDLEGTTVAEIDYT